MEYDIYFDDLNKQAQEDLLKLLNIKDEKEMNWDTMPITTIYIEKEND